MDFVETRISTETCVRSAMRRHPVAGAAVRLADGLRVGGGGAAGLRGARDARRQQPVLVRRLRQKVRRPQGPQVLTLPLPADAPPQALRL